MMFYILHKYIVVYFCFLTWPTRTNAASPTSLEDLEPPGRPIPTQWLPTAIRRTLDSTLKSNMMSISDSEPGFDFTDEEMTKFKIWPRGVIPYYPDEYSFDKVLRDRLRYYLITVNQLTGLKFLELSKPPSDENTRWVLFINRRGILDCFPHTTHYFTNTGVQKVVLGYDCFVDGGGLAASILGIAGVPPMHTAPNKGSFIVINSQNIIEDKKYLFEELPKTEWLFHEVPYEYTSAGHFPWHQYSNTNGASTTQPRSQLNVDAGGNRDFTYNDIWKIRMLYNYIRNKKSSGDTVPLCKNLFEPGVNFKDYKPEYIDQQEPRPKPNQYLGKPYLDAQNEVNETQFSGEVTPNSTNDSNNIYQANNENDGAPLTIDGSTEKQDTFDDNTHLDGRNAKGDFSKNSLLNLRRWGFNTEKTAAQTKRMSRYEILKLPEFQNLHIKRKILRKIR